MSGTAGLAPEFDVSEWIGGPPDLSLAELRGKVVVAYAFQMLCPGCVAEALPQARRLAAVFPREMVAVLGLHTVFEHHEAMMPLALRAFIQEYRIDFPVGVDRANGRELPRTMARYRMQGTPTILMIDRAGRLRRQHFGHVDDIALGAEVMALVAEAASPQAAAGAPAGRGCTDGECAA
ncbi:TlpA disulfide reductase family protein [Chelatococcus sp. SYSU_G07232]|uniref:TlpA disulfide reductase family protein n=1 Tax=Chelatococcus albus TaxID=3047466 RepID=A0ABT7AJI6_9HYPH|nr:TlpA disulfide reductase family protein [Chelatococcus sp. SYSU_G07232]MDJ1159533.1 TlpA disulfide reductase family protein [Chelatococcus sp. SYSU_G07232]